MSKINKYLYGEQFGPKNKGINPEFIKSQMESVLVTLDGINGKEKRSYAKLYKEFVKSIESKLNVTKEIK